MLVSHFLYNVLILNDIWNTRRLSWNWNSYMTCNFFLLDYAIVLMLAFWLTKSTAYRLLRCLNRPCSPLEAVNIAKSRVFLLENYRCESSTCLDSARIEILLRNLMDRHRREAFLFVLQTVDCEEFRKRAYTHRHIYQEGYIYLASLWPYDILYCNVRQRGLFLCFGKHLALFLLALLFTRVLFWLGNCLQ